VAAAQVCGPSLRPESAVSRRVVANEGCSIRWATRRRRLRPPAAAAAAIRLAWPRALCQSPPVGGERRPADEFRVDQGHEHGHVVAPPRVGTHGRPGQGGTRNESVRTRLLLVEEQRAAEQTGKESVSALRRHGQGGGGGGEAISAGARKSNRCWCHCGAAIRADVKRQSVPMRTRQSVAARTSAMALPFFGVRAGARHGISRGISSKIVPALITPSRVRGWPLVKCVQRALRCAPAAVGLEVPLGQHLKREG
jgi:hypothetical protein